MATGANPIAAAIFTKLTGASALTTLLNAGTAGVFETLAPQNEDPPYVVFNAQSPSTPQYAFGTAVKWEDAIYQVQAVTEGHTAAAAGTIADKIDDALNGATLTITGYTSMYVARVQTVDYPELAAGGKRFNHRGGLYRILARP